MMWANHCAMKNVCHFDPEIVSGFCSAAQRTDDLGMACRWGTPILGPCRNMGKHPTSMPWTSGYSWPSPSPWWIMTLPSFVEGRLGTGRKICFQQVSQAKISNYTTNIWSSAHMDDYIYIYHLYLYIILVCVYAVYRYKCCIHMYRMTHQQYW